MKQRLAITLIWIMAMVLSIILVGFYSFRHTEDGIVLLPRDQVIASIVPLLILYSGYVGGILTFWFVRPFRPPKTAVGDRIRFGLAIACTVIFNLVVLYFVSEIHLRGVGLTTIEDDVSSAAKIGGYMSFLVGPVNAYYFGMKPTVT